MEEVRKDLITTTAAVSALASFLMGLLANLPVGLAPGLGVNAYVSSSFCGDEVFSFGFNFLFFEKLAYSIVGFHGSGGNLTYGEALAAVFLEGCVLFCVVSVGFLFSFLTFFFF